MSLTRFSKDPGFDMNPSMLIDGNILDNSRRLVSSAVMNITLVSGRIALIFFTSLYPFIFRILISAKTKGSRAQEHYIDLIDNLTSIEVISKL